ncbi:MAG: M12 family metallo-peptidase [Planctomycetota bacterium]
MRFSSVGLAPVCTSLAVLATATLAPAQSPLAPVAAPAEVCRALDVTAASMQALDVRRSEVGIDLQVALDGTLVSARLRRHEMRTPGFRLLVDDGTALREATPAPCTTYRGELPGGMGRVAASLVGDGTVRATILWRDAMWSVQPLRDAVPGAPGPLHVVYRQRDLDLPPVRCGTTGLAPAAPPPPAAAALGSSFEVAELAIDADEPYYRALGSSTVAVQNDVTAVMNAVDAIYQRDVRVTHAITTIIVRTAPVYTTSDPGGLLNEFRDRWNMSHGAVPRDVAHLFTGRTRYTSTIGIASLGVVCNIGRAYGLSFTRFSSSMGSRVGLTAHELGHNWGASHCDADPSCFIMCSGLGGCSGSLGTFSPMPTLTIRSAARAAPCLGTTGPAPVLGALMPASVTSHQPQAILVTGQDLDSVRSVTVGGQPVGFAILETDALRIDLPSPFAIQTHQIVVTNRAGPSNALTLTVTGNHPGVIQVPIIIPRGLQLEVRAHTDAGWAALILDSPDMVPSALPGTVSLAIGNGFSTLFTFGAAIADGTGTARLPLLLPTSTPFLPPLHWQAIVFDPASSTLPLETTDVATSLFL